MKNSTLAELKTKQTNEDAGEFINQDLLKKLMKETIGYLKAKYR